MGDIAHMQGDYNFLFCSKWQNQDMGSPNQKITLAIVDNHNAAKNKIFGELQNKFLGLISGTIWEIGRQEDGKIKSIKEKLKHQHCDFE